MGENILINKKLIMLAVILAGLLVMGAVSASDVDVNDTKIVSSQETVSVENDFDKLCADEEGNYADLKNDIESGGILTKKVYRYAAGGGESIEIKNSGVIEGNGAVIDMDGSNIRAFMVTSSDVTIKNLTIKNANFNADGGAIYFDWDSSGTVVNCNFAGNKITGDYICGGAICFSKTGNVKNCTFTDNHVNGISSAGGAIYMYSGSVEACNFAYNSASYGGAVYFENWGNANVANCNFTANNAVNGGAIRFDDGNVKNCNFLNNTANSGGAVFCYSHDNGSVENCNFNDNRADTGGAVYFLYNGDVANCNFNDNRANLWGGAVYIDDDSSVRNCNFNGNNATEGSAIVYRGDSATNSISNSIFLNNRANAYSLDIKENGNTIEITFRGCNNLLNAVYSYSDVSLTNVTYWGANGISNTGKSEVVQSPSDKEAGQNITVIMVANDIPVLNEIKLTDENGTIALDAVAGKCEVTALHNADSYYTQAKKTKTFMIEGNQTTLELSASGSTVTAKITPDDVEGNITFIVKNESGVVGTHVGALNGGASEIDLSGLESGMYNITAIYKTTSIYKSSNSTISFVVLKETSIAASNVNTVYNGGKYLIITLKDVDGKAVSGVRVTVKFSNAKTVTSPATDKNGQVKVSLNALAAVKTYKATITFAGNKNYAKSTKTVSVKVTKATPKLTASKKTFKKSLKIKKYTVTLKSNQNRVMKNTWVSLKVNKKTYKVKTNSKGQATFKIGNLKKKGTFTATVKYAGSKYYNAKTVKPKIVVR